MLITANITESNHLKINKYIIAQLHINVTSNFFFLFGTLSHSRSLFNNNSTLGSSLPFDKAVSICYQRKKYIR